MSVLVLQLISREAEDLIRCMASPASPHSAVSLKKIFKKIGIFQVCREQNSASFLERSKHLHIKQFKKRFSH